MNISSHIKFILLGIAVIGIVQFASAARPSTAPNSNPSLLYSGSFGSQSKEGTLILKNTQTPQISSGFTFETDGSVITSGLLVRTVSGAEGNVHATGTITSEALGTSTGKNFVCADTDGVIIRCP